VSLKYSPKVNARRTEVRGASAAQRHEQFDHINEQRADFGTTAIPSSVSIRKKELIGDFKNAGRTWRKLAEPVLVHDWPQDAIGQAIPYGVYEVSANQGFVCVGDCFDRRALPWGQLVTGGSSKDRSATATRIVY
jgi:hypothetical protein